MFPRATIGRMTWPVGPDRMCGNLQKATGARLVESPRLRLMPPPRTGDGCTASVAEQPTRSPTSLAPSRSCASPRSLGSFAAPPRAHEVDRSASGIEGAGEGAPTAPDTNVGLIDTPGPLGGLEMTAQPLLQLGTVVLDPAPDGRVVRFQTALAEPLFAIAERERVPQVPAHSAQNQLGLGLSPREDRRSNGLLHQSVQATSRRWPKLQHNRPSPHATPLGHRHRFLGGGRDLDHQRGGGTGGVRAVLPPTAWKQLADAQVDGWRRWDPEASPRPQSVMVARR